MGTMRGRVYSISCIVVVEWSEGGRWFDGFTPDWVITRPFNPGTVTQ